MICAVSLVIEKHYAVGGTRMRRSISWVLAICLCLSLPLAAQKFTGTIRGTVTDPSGAVVPGADVTVSDPANGDTRTVKTSTTGDFIFNDLAASTYNLTVKGTGFKEYVTNGVQLFVSSTATVNVQMTMGGATEQVIVESDAVQVETSTGAVGNVIEGNAVRELPLNGRSFAQLTQLMPGVSPASNFDSKHKGLEAGVDFSVNGNNTTGNLFLVDGVNNNDVGSNRTIVIYPSIDSIQEFKLLRNSYGPEYGGAMGAIINITTKTGTNQFHGGAYYFGRNDALNATDYFNNFNHAKKDKLRRNDYGYDVGGPIMKDKWFFFWSQEWNKELRGKLRSAGVPTVAEKNNDFSQLRVVNGQACEGNPGATSVPVGNLSQTGQLLLNLFPDPNVTNPSDCHSNWVKSLASPIYWRQESIRSDYNLSKTWKLMGRFTQDHWNQASPSTLGYWGDDNYPSVDPTWVQPGYQASVRLTKLIGSSAVNDFQVSYTANRITVTAVEDAQHKGIIQAINNSYSTYFPTSGKYLGKNVGYPIFWGGLGSGAGDQNLWNMGPWHNNEELYSAKDDFSKVVGSHSFKVGFLASNNKKNELSGGSSAEAANYWGTASNNSGNGAFNALDNRTTWGFGEPQTNPFAHTRWHDYELYAGDTWKVRRNVTVEYGFRWSFLRNPFSSKDIISNWQPSAFDPNLTKPDPNDPTKTVSAVSDGCNGILQVPGTNFCKTAGFVGGARGVNRSLKQNNNHEISPRVGIAWDPKGDGKMVLRGGFGLFYQRERVTNYLLLGTNSPFSLSVNGKRPLDGAITPGSLSGNASPSWGLDPSDRTPYTTQYNFTFEREVARGSKIELAYVGNRGSNILRYRDANAVLPANRLHYAVNNSSSDRFTGAAGFGQISYGEWTSKSNYNSLQALFRSHVKSLDAQFAYTWSKSLSDTDITNSGNTSNTSVITDITNPHLDYGPTPIDRRHVFVSNISYNLPELRGRSPLMRTALGGWQLGTIMGYGSGPSQTVFGLGGGAGNGFLPNTIETGSTGAPGGIQGTGYSNNQKPNRLLQDCRNHGGDKQQWYNPAAFSLDGYQLATFGNSGVGSCTGPGLANTDFSIFKNFKLTERIGLQFRMEFFNVFNKVQFRADNNNFQLANSATACDAVNNGILNTLDPVSSATGSYSTACFGRTPGTVAYITQQFADPNATGANAGHTINVDTQGNFGRITNDRGPREIQYALKFSF